MTIAARKQIASLISDVLNPFIVSIVLIFILSVASSGSTVDVFKWAFLALGLSVIPVFCVILFWFRKGKLDTIFTSIRQQRTRIYLIASLIAIAGCLILYYTNAPLTLLAGFISGLLSIIVYMVINLWWKISLHTAFVAGAVTMLVILYEWAGAATLVLIPLTAWSRIELNNHSLAQTIIGALLSSTIVVIVFSQLGVV